MNAVTISNLTVRARIGYETPEREQPQDLAIDLTMETDFAAVIISHDVDRDGVNYSVVRRSIEALVEGREFKMLENLAHEMFKIIFGNPRVTRATIAIRKPQRWQNAVPGIVMTCESKDFV